MTQIWPQLQSANYHDWMVDVCRQLGGVQLFNPWRGAWWKFTDAGVTTLGRYIAHNDADKQLIRQGAEGAEIWWRDWFWPMAQQCGGIIKWCGANEWPLFGAADAILCDQFYSRLADIFHDNGKELVAYRKSTHHWEFGLWQYLGESLSKVDYMATHHYEYGARMDFSDTNGLMRLVKDVEAIRSYGYRVPPTICTEVGYDTDPQQAGGHQGWLSRGIDRNAYTTELVQLMLRFGSQVPELVAISPFLSEAEDPAWSSFVLDRETLEMLVTKVLPAYSVPDSLPLITPEYLRWARGYKVPINPDGALAKSIIAAGQLPESDEFDHNGVAARQWGYRRSDATWHLWQWEAGKAPRIIHTEAARRE